MGERWTWDAAADPGVTTVFSGPDWCHRLESEASDAVVGKVLCVCAALAIAREVVGETPADPRVAEALDLLERWIDDPTDERFDRICDTLFGDGAQAEIGPHDVIWWALRTATSSVGNTEAGWALSSTCSAAEASGFAREQLRGLAERALQARRQEAGRGAAT